MFLGLKLFHSLNGYFLWASLLGFLVFKVGRPAVCFFKCSWRLGCVSRPDTVSQTSRREAGASRGCNDELDIGDGLLLLNCDPLPQSRLKWHLLIFFIVLGSHLPLSRKLLGGFAALLGGSAESYNVV